MIDTVEKTATFEVRDNLGALRVDSLGFAMTEALRYE
jgi:hypothetical protein